MLATTLVESGYDGLRDGVGFILEEFVASEFNRDELDGRRSGALHVSKRITASSRKGAIQPAHTNGGHQHDQKFPASQNVTGACIAPRVYCRGLVPALVGAATLISPAARAANPKVVLGAGIDATYGEIFVAVDKGLFAKRGIDAEYKTFEAGGMSISAAAAGTVQVGAAGELPGLKPVSDGARIVYVATGPDHRPLRRHRRCRRHFETRGSHRQEGGGPERIDERTLPNPVLPQIRSRWQESTSSTSPFPR